MRTLIKRLIRAGAFIGKEIAEVRRQPRLVLSLILGPFLILLLFGIGYQGETSTLSGILVVPATGGYSQNIADYQKLVGSQLNIVSVTTNEQQALSDLNRHTVDLVVIVPEDIGREISAGAQVKVPVYFNEVDPLRRDWITYLTYIYTSELNKQTLAAAASQSQEDAGDVRSGLARIRKSLDTIEQHIDRGEFDRASEEARGMQGSSSSVQLAMALMAGLLNSQNAVIKPPEPQDPEQVDLLESGQMSDRLAADVQALNDELSSPNPDKARIKERIGRLREDVDSMDRLTQQFQSINPLVLAAPFYGEARNTAPLVPSFTAFYAPAVLVLLLQHIAITLGALSMVRERMLGTVELFRVAPVRPGEILFGKYISFMILLAVIAGVLLLMMSNELTIEGFRLSLGVPILGDYATLALTLLLVIFASVGIGFFISTVSKSESQAVQLSMLVLLASVFFSGFFLRIETLWPPIRSVSYSLPVTYGIQSLQVVMLRGAEPATWLLLALLGLGVFFAGLSFFLFSKELKRG
jgi:ABC-2 type transport system permease protein